MNLRKRIFVRSVMLIVSLIVLIVAAHAVYTVGSHHREIEEGFTEKIAVRAAELETLMLSGDRAAVTQLLESILSARYVAYAFVERDDGPYAWTFPDGVPGILPGRHASASPEQWHFEDEAGARFEDFFTQVGNTGGVLHIGLSVDEMNDNVTPLLMRTAALAGAAILAAIILSLFLARWTTREVDSTTTALRENEEQLERYLSGMDTIGMGLFVVDRDYRVRDMNNTMIGWYGDQRGKICYESVGASANPCPYCQIRNVIDSGETVNYQPTIPGGRILDVVSTPIRNSDGTISKLEIIREITQSERAHETLRESEESFRDLAEMLPETVFETDMKLRLTFVNQRALEIFGYSAEDVSRGLNALEMIAPEDRDRAEAGVVNHLKGEGRGATEYQAQRKDGSLFPVLLHSSAIVKKGKILGLRGIIVDISERRRSEEELRFRAMLLDVISDHITATDLEGRITYVNQAESDKMGRPREELIGKLVDIYGDDPSEGATQREIAETTREKGEWRGEIVNFTSAGERIVVECGTWLLRDEEGNPIGMCGTARDITNRKKAEAERERLMSAIEQAAEIFIITDSEWTIQYVNPAFEQITGYGRDEAIGQTTNILHSGEQDEHFYRELKDTLARGETWRGRFINKKKDGTLYTEEATISPVHDASGQTINYVAVKHDITQTIKLEEQFRQAQKMEAVGQLAGGVAHDFNNLLQVINGYSELALGDLSAEHPALERVREVAKAGKRATTLVSQLLAFSRQQVLDMRDVNLNDVVADLLKMIRRVIGEHITLDLLPAHNLGIVRADPGQIEQILMNLCVNARDAMPNGGTIIIETRNVRIDEAYCQTHPWAEPGQFVLLSVTDTGSGMDRGTLANIFEPFFTTKEIGDGTGLGLSTVYGLVKQHAGMVDVRSQIGTGTTFEIYLPLTEHSAAELGDKIEDRTQGGTETILLAEDDAAVLGVARAFLEHAGYTVLTARDGEEALSVFEEHAEAIDLVLLDAMMPKLGGRAAFERIRERRPETRGLFSSGYSMSAIHTNFVLDEDVQLIQKPYERDTLLRRVREVLDS